MANSAQQFNRANPRSQQVISPLLRLALLLGVALHLAGFLFFSVISSPLPQRAARPSFVQYVSPDSLASESELEEQAALFDSAPLFIPTRWNASQAYSVNLRDAARDQFPEFEPEINLLRDLQPASLLFAPGLQVSAPIDLLASRFWRFFGGAPSEALVALSESQPIAEIVVLAGPIAETVSLPAALTYITAAPIARPVLYYLRVSADGVVWGAPTRGRSSGNEAFDAAAAEWLGRAEVRAQLPQGYLSITVFPW
ncbi:MAG TPA: hypothetical protein DD423_00175 [Opitutae bacterium]|nr:hypothetical protein [Opitutae bacterium]